MAMVASSLILSSSPEPTDYVAVGELDNEATQIGSDVP